MQVLFHPFTREVDARFRARVAALLREHWAILAPLLAVYYVAPTCAGDGVFADLSEAFGPSAITKVTPFHQLAMATSPHQFPLDIRTFSWMQGAFLVLYLLLEACTVLAVGEPHHLGERIDAFQQWYVQDLQRRAEAAPEPITPTPSEAVLPELDSYTLIRAGLWWTVLTRDRWTCCSYGRSARHDGVLLEVDHIVTRSQWGRDALENLQTFCRKYNQGKRNRDRTDLRGGATV